MDAVPEMQAALPPTAIGKDYPYDGCWLRPSPSQTGLRLTFGGCGGVTVGWIEGLRSTSSAPSLASISAIPQ
jgi:hypothetical protein